MLTLKDLVAQQPSLRTTEENYLINIVHFQRMNWNQELVEQYQHSITASVNRQLDLGCVELTEVIYSAARSTNMMREIRYNKGRKIVGENKPWFNKLCVENKKRSKVC